LNFDPSGEDEKAGLLIFQNEQHYYFLAITHGNIPAGYSGNTRGYATYVRLYKSTNDSSRMEILASQPLPENTRENIRLQIRANGKTYSFYYAYANKPWQLLIDNIDGKFLSTKVAGGFVGSVFALYATAPKKIDSKAYFDWFEYTGNDEALRPKR